MRQPEVKKMCVGSSTHFCTCLVGRALGMAMHEDREEHGEEKVDVDRAVGVWDDATLLRVRVRHASM
jgi:hypothetical protein